MSAEALVHPTALCAGAQLGEGTQVLAFAAVSPGARLGAGCNIGEHALIGRDAVLGDGVHVGGGARVLPDVSVGPGVRVGENAVVGADAGPGAVIAPGGVVTAAVPAHAIVAGNPSKIDGYVTDRSHLGDPLDDGAPRQVEAEVGELLVPGVTVQQVTRVRDLRGSLAAVEFSDLPFAPQRAFTVFDVPSESIRGSHAHRTCHQLLICLTGSVRCLVDDGERRDQVRLDRPEVALYMPPLIWGTQYQYTSDAIVLVLASHPYDPADYIRSYDEFVKLTARA
jgi:UDP-2-acetamido-3-amino-2,3-dideoxy-glucuronate N-acetyltransferase